MILYVAGPMTGYPNFNYPAFIEAQDELISRRHIHAVLSPHANADKLIEPTWTDFMRLSLAQVVQADGVAVLPGWELSAGATLEVRVAQALRMPVLTVERWLQAS